MPKNAAARVASGPASGQVTSFERSRVVACLRLDEAGRIRWANELCREWLTGHCDGQVAGHELGEWVGRGDIERLEAAAASGAAQPVPLEIRSAAGALIRLDGELIPAAGEGGSMLVLIRGAGNAGAVRARLERSARLEALGSLTSGVAHDFNNLLTILVGNLALVAEEMRAEPQTFAKLRAARDAARRGSELIRQLLNFARQEPVAAEPIDPAAVVGRLGPLIERALGKRIDLVLELDAAAGSIHGNSAQLESVIVNLAVNARDAIDGKGTVTIRVSAANDGPEPVLCIEVADDGAGIPVDVVDRVFEPFFTTKAEGKGSGLGLSMVKTYAEQFGGRLELETGAGNGTRLRLLFPRIRESASDSAEMTMPLAALPTGTERIVVLTQDESLAAMIVQILSVLGYSCRTASDSAAAAALLQAEAAELVICDGFESGWSLPAGAGPTTPAGLWLSATSGPDATAGRAILHKPFALPDLAVAVRAALDPVPRGPRL